MPKNIDINEFNSLKQENLKLFQIEREASRKVKEYIKQFALWQNQVKVLIGELTENLKEIKNQEILARGTNRTEESKLLIAKSQQLQADINTIQEKLRHILLGRMQ